MILVNDGSRDGSWDVIAEPCPHPSASVIALNLLKNYGQHHANLAGLRESTGDYVITMDDDLQNPPDQALVLIDKAMDGHDVVFGQFERKQAAGYRRLGSRLIGLINRRIFGQPPDLVVSNFRILRRDVVDRICASRTAHPYITGQALMYSSNRANVDGPPRAAAGRQEQLQPAADPARWCSPSCSATPPGRCAPPRCCGFAISGLSFLLGGFYLVSARWSRTPGSRAGPRSWCCVVALQRLHHRAALDDRRVRRPHPQRGQHRGDATTSSERVTRMTRHFLVVGAQRCGTTYLHDAARRPPGDRDGPAGAARAQGVPRRRGRRPRRRVVRRHLVLRPRRPRRRCSARRAPATSRRPSAPDRVAAVARRARRSWSSCATRSPGRSPTGASAATTGSSRDRWPRRCARNLDGPLPWDPQATSVSPYAYLERGRYADHLAPWLDAFPDRCTCSSWRSWSRAPTGSASSTRWLGVDADVRPDSLGRAGQRRAERRRGLARRRAGRRLRDYFADSDRALAGLLGRELPWHDPVGGAR